MYRTHYPAILILSALVACGGKATSTTTPPVANTAAPPPGQREVATQRLRDFAASRRTSEPLFAATFEARTRELSGQLPIAAQCAYVAVLVTPPGWACDLADPTCARPADNNPPPPPPGPAFDPGCPAYPAVHRADSLTGPGLVSLSGDDGSRLEGCTVAAQLWLLDTCP